MQPSSGAGTFYHRSRPSVDSDMSSSDYLSAPGAPASRVDKKDTTSQEGCGTAVCAVVRAGRGERAGKRLAAPLQKAIASSHAAHAHTPPPPTPTTDAAIQTALEGRHATTQAPGCRVLSEDIGAGEGSTVLTCQTCAQVEELVHLVTEHQGQVSRLRSIRECESDTDHCRHTLLSPKQTQ